MANHTPQAVSDGAGLTEPPQAARAREKGPFSRQQMLFSNQPPSCWDVSAASWCPSINLGKLPGEQPSPPPAPPAPFSPRPSSIRSLSWTPYETPFSASTGLHALTPPAPPPLAAVATPRPQALPSWFPRKGRGGNIASRPSEVRALGEFFSLPNQFPSRCIYFSHPTPGTHTSQAHTSGSSLHLGLPRWGDPIS